MMTCGTSPFRWWVIDNWWPTRVPALPSLDSAVWEARYENDCERGKRTSRSIPELGLGEVFNRLRGPESVSFWSQVLGYSVQDDPELHGGGLHVMEPGGWLNTHLDYDRHPIRSTKRRALNLVLFLNEEWTREWGGALCLCDPMGGVVHRIHPAFGRLAAFEVGDLSYHGVETVTGSTDRITAAVYFLNEATERNTRCRALFIPTRSTRVHAAPETRR